jgi:hypothetical protein
MGLIHGRTVVAGANGVLYSKVINDVIPNQPVIVEAYLANLFRANFVGSVDPSFSFELVDIAGNIIAQHPYSAYSNQQEFHQFQQFLVLAWVLRSVSFKSRKYHLNFPYQIG